MARFRISASVVVDVVIEIEAEDAKAAERMFTDKIAMNATMVDIPSGSFSVEEDSITDIDSIDVDAV